MRDLAAWAAVNVGTVLVPDERGEAAPARFLLEARLRGLAPLVPWARWAAHVARPLPAVAVVVDTAAIAAALKLAVAATLDEHAGAARRFGAPTSHAGQA